MGESTGFERFLLPEVVSFPVSDHLPRLLESSDLLGGPDREHEHSCDHDEGLNGVDPYHCFDASLVKSQLNRFDCDVFSPNLF